MADEKIIPFKKRSSIFSLEEFYRDKEKYEIEEQKIKDAEQLKKEGKVTRADKFGNKLQWLESDGKSRGAGWYTISKDGTFHNPSTLNKFQLDNLGIKHELTPKTKPILNNIGGNVFKINKHPNAMMTAEDAWKAFPERMHANTVEKLAKNPNTIWTKASNLATKVLKSPLGRLGSRFIGGVPAMIGMELDWSNPGNYFMPKYEYNPENREIEKTIWE